MSKNTFVLLYINFPRKCSLVTYFNDYGHGHVEIFDIITGNVAIDSVTFKIYDLHSRLNQTTFNDRLIFMDIVRMIRFLPKGKVNNGTLLN